MWLEISIGSLADFPDGKAKVINDDGISGVINHVDDKFYAVENRYAHLGLPLGANKVDDTIITCPFHGKQFDMCTGENLDWVTGIAGTKLPEWSRKLLAMGKKPMPIKTFNVISEKRPAVTLGALFAALKRPFTGSLLITRFLFGLAFAISQTIFSLYALNKFNLTAQQTGYVLTSVFSRSSCRAS